MPRVVERPHVSDRMGGRAKVYVETTIVSYLTARPSRDLVVASHQQVTHEWWTCERHRFDLCVSEFVLAEARAGDRDAARRRSTLIAEMKLLHVTDDAIQLAEHLVADASIPARAGTDAPHVAMAAVHQVDYLLTWNCRHIANAATRRGLEAACRVLGYALPVLCTPEELVR